MEGRPSIAHALPELYRAVLERVASLEYAGLRAEGLLIRREAIRVYSRAWDEAALKRLDALRGRAERLLDGNPWRRDPGLSRPAVQPTQRA